MRVGLTLGNELDAREMERKAVEAESLGLWAVEVSGTPGVEMIRAGRLCAVTSSVRLVVRVQLGAEHPFTVAEELAVLDNLAGGRIGVVTEGGTSEERGILAEALACRPVNGSLVTPPPVQTRIETWADVATQPGQILPVEGALAPGRTALTGDLEGDRSLVDQWMAAGCTHLLVDCPGDSRLLARHLMTRAAMVDYPDIVSTMADQLAPFD